ncbi:hypothetical protein [Kocuria sp.]|uniref:hypothetical protein n=1 Tax=Kocuria sp. TaxID=1871328 RepID=UPI0026E05DC1|nr:hypothetical protein [Kocuria sp.]MDO5619331.1 hypothetical protein [Kocuria sp.]
MVQISTDKLMIWEDPNAFETLIMDLDRGGRIFDTKVWDATDAWDNLKFYYEGESDEYLHTALNKPRDSLEPIADLVGNVVGALYDFGAELRTLRRERDEYETEVASFNRSYADQEVEDLDSEGWRKWGDLVGKDSILQKRYEDLVDNTISSMRIKQGIWGDFSEAVTGKIYDVGFQMGTGIEINRETTETRRVTEKNFGPMGQESGPDVKIQNRETFIDSKHKFSFPRNPFIPDFIDNLMMGVAGGVAVKNSGASVPRHGIGKSPKIETSQRSNHSRSPRVTESITRTRTVEKSKMTSAVNKGSTLAAAAQTGWSFAEKYAAEKSSNVEEVILNNPDASVEEIERESSRRATANAATQTVVDLGSSGAFGLAGAMIFGGSTGGAGAVVGGASGSFVGSVLASNAKFLPDQDGDGRRESISEFTGDVVEDILYAPRSPLDVKAKEMGFQGR